MNRISFDIVRICLAITFVWIGVLIFRQPEAWGSLVQPWVLALLPVSLREVMLSTAVLDTGIGLLFLFRPTAWFAGLAGGLHIVTVLIACGINDITVRDIGLMGGAFGVMAVSLPARIREKLGQH